MYQTRDHEGYEQGCIRNVPDIESIARGMPVERADVSKDHEIVKSYVQTCIKLDEYAPKLSEMKAVVEKLQAEQSMLDGELKGLVSIQNPVRVFQAHKKVLVIAWVPDKSVYRKIVSVEYPQ